MNEKELLSYYRKKFSIILTRILTLLKIDMGSPFRFEMSSIIFSIPERYEWKESCIHMYTLLYEEYKNIKENEKVLEEIYEYLVSIEKSISNKE